MIPRVQAVTDTIAGERARFARFCRALSADELAQPVPESTWIVKDFISHLATIDGPITAWFAAIADRTPSRGAALGSDGGAWSVDRFNDEAVAKRRARSVDEVLAEAAGEREALLRVLARLTDEQLDRTIHFGGDSKRAPRDIPFAQYLQGWARHDVIHVADMLKGLPERRDDPEIVAWLGDPEIRGVVDFYQKAMA